MKTSDASSISAGIFGLLVGDALGVPYEFHSPEQIPPFEAIEMSPPQGFRSAHRVPPGTWSDDGAQALCLAATLAHRGGFHAVDFANRLRNWANVGYLAVDAHVFDMGMQTQRALHNLAGGFPPESAGPSSETDNGNGSLMRALPIALWHGNVTSQLIADAEAQSRITHGHARSRVCCAFYCVIACMLSKSHSFERAWQQAAEALRQHYLLDTEERRELDYILDPVHAQSVRGSGYVLDSLWSVRACLIDDPGYEAAVKRAIALGRDTDTTACIVGGLAGLLYGLDAIPQRWRDALRGRELLDPVLADFTAAVARRASD
jgi:ADP-ribosyl-[dinitrogen reductase] hydrolase